MLWRWWKWFYTPAHALQSREILGQSRGTASPISWPWAVWVEAPWGEVKDALNPCRQQLQAPATVTAGFVELVITSKSLNIQASCCIQASILLEKLDAHGLKGCTSYWGENWLNGWAQRVVVNLNPAGGWSPVVSSGLSIRARPGFLSYGIQNRESPCRGPMFKKSLWLNYMKKIFNYGRELS